MNHVWPAPSAASGSSDSGASAHATSSPTDNWPEVERQARSILGEKLADWIVSCRQKPHPESQLIAVLHQVQAQFGYLGQAHLDAVSQLMQIPAAKVSGVASFYHYYRLQPRGRFIINICLGTACYVKGADRVAKKFMEELGVHFGETTPDGLFTLENSRCLGACGLAPVVMIGQDVHAQVAPDQVPLILEKYLQKVRAESSTASESP